MLKGLQESLLVLYVAVGKGTQPSLPNSVAPAGLSSSSAVCCHSYIYPGAGLWKNYYMQCWDVN